MTTAIEKKNRVDLIYQMLLVGFTTFEIKKYAKTQTDWKVTEGAVQKYIDAAKLIIKNTSKEWENSEFELAVNRLEDLYHRSHKTGKIKDALEVIKEKNKLLGLNAPEKKDISIKDYRKLSDDDLVQIIGEKE
jgi:hypothetical protein